MKCNFPQKRTVYELLAIQKRWSSSKKSVFGEKSVQKLLNKKIKTHFFKKATFFLIADYSETVHFWALVTFSYGKRQKSCCLIVI